MIRLEQSEIEGMKGYILGKRVYDKVFPQFYDLIAQEVEKVLRPNYPLFEPAIGPRDRARAMKKLPHLEENVPLDWVAFGFSGIDLYDFHVGVILLRENWPVEYHIGLHIMEPIWSFVRNEVERIDWKGNLGWVPDYIYQAPVHEHRFLDPVRELDFGNLEKEVKYISDRAIRFYRTGAPLAEKWANKEK